FANCEIYIIFTWCICLLKGIKMKPDLLNINGILGVDLKDIKEKYYIIKKAEETYESNINFFKKEIFQHGSAYENFFVSNLFDGKKEIYNYLENKYYFGIGRSKYYLNAGLGCESYMSKEQFSNFIDNEINDDPIASREDIIKFMYSYEVRALIADLEKLIIQIEECTYIFYDKFNNPKIFKSHETKEGLTTIYSMESRLINTILEAIIIKSTSILDYLSKLVFEVENMPKSFTTYPKRKSVDYNHGKTKLDQTEQSLWINWSEEERKNTIFDESIKEIFILKRLRNQIIHDGFLDVDNIIYENKINGVLQERFILMPDFNNKKFEEYRGRKLFYSQDKKINLELPNLIQVLLSTTNYTLNVLIKKYWFGTLSADFVLSISSD
ncbi:hypothetical protein, partial [Acinetobacter baumannii]